MHKSQQSATAGAGMGAKILQFKVRTTPQRRVAARSPISNPLQHFDAEDDRKRMQQNLAAAVVVVLLVVSGFWIIDHLRTSSRIAACIEAGHRNCMLLDPNFVQQH